MVTFKNNAITGVQSWGGSANNGDFSLSAFTFSDRNGQVSGRRYQWRFVLINP